METHPYQRESSRELALVTSKPALAEQVKAQRSRGGAIRANPVLLAGPATRVCFHIIRNLETMHD